MAKYTKDYISPIQRLKKLFFSEKKDILLLIALTISYGLIGLATPIAVQSLVNIVTMGGVTQPLYVIGLILFTLLFLYGFIYVSEFYIVELIQRRIFFNQSILIAKNTHSIQIQIYDDNNPVELVNRYFDIQTVQKSIASLLTTGLTAFLQLLIGSIVILFYSIYFSIFIAVSLIMLWFIVVFIHKIAEESAINESEAKYEMAAWLESIARNKWSSKFYNSSSRIVTQTLNLINYYLEQRSSHFNLLLWQLIGAVSIYAIIGTGMLVLGGLLVIKGSINLGQFVAAELIIFGVLSAYVKFISKLESFYDLLAALSKLSVIETLPLEQINDNLNNIKISSFNSLKVSNLSFLFENRFNLLSNVSFNLNIGKSIAFIGGVGSGKSSLIELLCGLRAPSSGIIQYNNIDIRNIDISLLRNSIGIANKPEWLNATILENISLGRDIEHSRCIHILDKLGLWDDISQFKDALNTKITDFGSPLSYSQLQMLMLARAFVINPNILIIDGLLDSISANELSKVMELINEIQHDTMIIVTTRFDYIASKFDYIINLE